MRDTRDHISGWECDNHLDDCVEYTPQYVDGVLEDLNKLAARMAATISCSEGANPEQSDADLKGSSDLVRRHYVALKQSGVATSEVTVHIEASRLADVASEAPHGNWMCLHGFATVAANLALRSKWASRKRPGNNNAMKALIVAVAVLAAWLGAWRATTGMADKPKLESRAYQRGAICGPRCGCSARTG